MEDLPALHFRIPGLGFWGRALWDPESSSDEANEQDSDFGEVLDFARREMVAEMGIRDTPHNPPTREPLRGPATL